MPNFDLLGVFEQLVLMAIVHLKEDAYGVTVRRDVEERTGRTVSLGAVYATLDRLEKKGYVSSYEGDRPPHAEGGESDSFALNEPGSRLCNSRCKPSNP